MTAPTEGPGETSAPSTGGSTGSAAPTPSPTTAGVTLKPGQTLVAQGSKEADALVHAFVDDPGKRVELNVVILPESTLYPRRQWIMRLWYNCQGLGEGEPPAQDLCDSVMLVFDDADPEPNLFRRPLRIEMRGTAQPCRGGRSAATALSEVSVSTASPSTASTALSDPAPA